MPVERSINTKVARLLHVLPFSSMSLVLCFPATMCTMFPCYHVASWLLRY